VPPPDPRQSQQQLCYGTVVKNMGSQHGAVRRLLVQVTGGNVVPLLTTQVYTFAPTRPTARAGTWSSPHSRVRACQITGGAGSTGRVGTKSGQPGSALAAGALGAAGVMDACSTQDKGDGGAVGAGELMGAVHDILRRVGLSLDKDSRELMSETLVLRDTTARQEARLAQLTKENADMQDRMLCKICMAREVQKIILPSGKLLCGECVGRIRGVCPFTRRPVNGIETVHFD
jgi:hypothetical protein